MTTSKTDIAARQRRGTAKRKRKRKKRATGTLFTRLGTNSPGSTNVEAELAERIDDMIREQFDRLMEARKKKRAE